MATFKKSRLLNDFCQAIIDLQPCPVAGVVTVDQVKIALGEMLDIWPDSIAPEYAKLG